MSDSSSSGEDESKLKDALAEDCIWKVTDSVNSTKKSIRESLVHSEQYSFDFPSNFKKHIATKLSQQLDRLIEEVTVEQKTELSKSLDDNNGIMLFSFSKKKISEPMGLVEEKQQRIQFSQDSSYSESEDEKLAEAAVSSSWVLQQQKLMIDLECKSIKDHQLLEGKSNNVSNQNEMDGNITKGHKKKKQKCNHLDNNKQSEMKYNDFHRHYKSTFETSTSNTIDNSIANKLSNKKIEVTMHKKKKKKSKKEKVNNNQNYNMELEKKHKDSHKHHALKKQAYFETITSKEIGNMIVNEQFVSGKEFKHKKHKKSNKDKKSIDY